MTTDEAWGTLKPRNPGSSGCTPRDSYRLAVRTLVAAGFTQKQISERSRLARKSVYDYATTKTQAEVAAAGLYVPPGRTQ